VNLVHAIGISGKIAEKVLSGEAGKNK